MKIVVFVEGKTEKRALPDFLGRWLGPPRLRERVGIETVMLSGWRKYLKEVPRRIPLHLARPVKAGVLACAGLLDFHGPSIYPAGMSTANAR